MTERYDVITVGGGLAGTTLAKSLAEHGLSVLVVEQEKTFKDRVRGEQMQPWGVAEARTLGVYDLLLAGCGHEQPWIDMYLGPAQIAHRNLTQTRVIGLQAAFGAKESDQRGRIAGPITNVIRYTVRKALFGVGESHHGTHGNCFRKRTSF